VVKVVNQISAAMGIAEGTSGVQGSASEIRPPIRDFVRTLPDLRRRAYAGARSGWDSGVTAQMVEASYGVIDVLRSALVSLAEYYPTGHFETDNPRDYFSELIATRFRWHRYHHEPDGAGQNGTMVNVMVGGSVIDDVGTMVEEMVRSLTIDSMTPDEWKKWETNWNLV
jgi:hypothetical protein